MSEKNNTIKQLGEKLSGIDFPYSWIEGDKCTESFISGGYFYAVSGIDVKRMFKDNTIIGSAFHTKEAEFCYLGGLYSIPELPPIKQAETILYSAESILNQAGNEI